MATVFIVTQDLGKPHCPATLKMEVFLLLPAGGCRSRTGPGFRAQLSSSLRPEPSDPLLGWEMAGAALSLCGSSAGFWICSPPPPCETCSSVAVSVFTEVLLSRLSNSRMLSLPAENPTAISKTSLPISPPAHPVSALGNPSCTLGVFGVTHSRYFLYVGPYNIWSFVTAVLDGAERCPGSSVW